MEAEKSKSAQDRVLPVFVVVATKFKPNSTMRPVMELTLSTHGQLSRLGEADSLVRSVRGCQQFSALHARLAGSGDTTIAKASLNQWEAGGSKARYHLFLSERSKPSNIIFETIIVPKER